MARKQQDDTFDDRALTEKLAAGDFRSVDSAQAVSATRTATNVVGGFVGKIVPGLEVLDVGLSALEGETQARKDARKISHEIGDLNKLARSNRTFRRKKHELDTRWHDTTTEAVVAAGGGMGGGAGGAALGAMIGTGIPIPIVGTLSGATIGFIAGSFAGGMTANKLYTATCVNQAHDPVTLNQQICNMHSAGEQVPKELVFAALAANLSGKEGKRADKLLAAYTKPKSTKLYAEALQDPKGFEKLGAMMNDPSVRNSIRAQTKLPRDPSSPGKSTVAQYTDLINSGALDPRDLFKPSAGAVAMTRAASQQAPDTIAQVPVLPGIDRARDRSV